MFEPFQRDVERGVEDSMRLFERAHVGEVAPVEPRTPTKVLVVLDGSGQDALSVRFARYFRERCRASIAVLDAREASDSNAHAQSVAGEIGGQALAKHTGESFQQVLDAMAESGGDLAILPCPFGRDLETVGPDSTGTVIDVVLARSSVPLLVLRQPYDAAERPFDRAVLILLGENRAAPDAAAWSTGLAKCAGVPLTLALEASFYEDVGELMRALDPSLEIGPEALADALVKTHARMHRALQKSAEREGITYHLSLHEEHNPLQQALDSADDHPLLTLALEHGNHASEGHVRDRIRLSRHSLLVVPAPA